MSESRPERQPLLPIEEVESTPVYPVIHMIKNDIVVCFWAYVSLTPSNERGKRPFLNSILSILLFHSKPQMMAPDLTYTLIIPLEEKYNAIQRSGNKSVPFCFLLVRVHFLRDKNITTTSLSRSRAALCEILATRILRDFGDSLLDLTRALTTSWPVYSGADDRVIARAKDRDDLDDRVGNAIEMAILGRAKRFIGSSSCQRVISSIWTGTCVYQADSSRSILSDNYKRLPVHFYDPHHAPLLDHSRLKVPAIRSVLEYFNFVILFTLFLLAIELNEVKHINTAELIFIIYALGFSLEKVAAMQEHGVRVFFTGTWNGFDTALITTYFVYASLRIYGVYCHQHWARLAGTDTLALMACLLFPRLAFVTLKNNLMVLSLRAMMMQFMFLMLIAAWCFGGFLYALWILSRTGPKYSAGTIAWWMLDLWFGLDASGFDKATQFHPYFGPVLMVTYACLSNTLLLTVLVSILSHTFSTINEDAAAEAMFRKAVSTIEGVKADSLFSYQPPINLLALLIMLPARYILSPRWFHKVNVFMIRLTNLPILLAIAWFERSRKAAGSSGFRDTVAANIETVFDTLPRELKKRMTIFEGFVGAESEIDAIFEFEEANTMLDGDNLPVRGSSGSTHPDDEAQSVPPQTSASSSMPTQRPSPSIQIPISPRSPRAKATAISGRSMDVAQSLTSPLAQIYMPVVVDENTSGNGPDASTNLASGISYGPARRRLTSMHRRPGKEIVGTSAVHSSGIPAHKCSSTAISESPDTDFATQRSPEKRLKTTVETEQVEETSSGVELATRLADIEKRQIRIEELLLNLAKH